MGEPDREQKVAHHVVTEETTAEIIATTPDGTDWHVLIEDIHHVDEGGERMVGRVSAVDHHAITHIPDIEVELPPQIDTLDNQLTFVAEPDTNTDVAPANRIVSKELLTRIGAAAGSVGLTALTGYAFFKWQQKKKSY